MNDNKLNKKLIIEKATIKDKKKGINFSILLLILLIGVLLTFIILEYLGYINYLEII